MKLPPLLTEKIVQADSAARSERDRSFLIFAGVVLMAIALGFKSELLGPGQVWALALGLVVAGAYLVIVTLPFNPILRLLWIFTITFLASYRSLRINGTPIAPRRAFIFALFVGQVVTFLAWAITALSLYLVVNEGTFAVMLLFAWYINRGLVRHTVEDSFTRNVVLEYGAFAIVLIYLFVSSYQPGR